MPICIQFKQLFKSQTDQFQSLFKILLLSTVLALGACSRDGDAVLDQSVKLNQPDSFAAFINPIAGLASGDYVIEANVDNAGDAGGFTLSVTYDDGTTEEYAGSWTTDVATSTRRYNITLFTAGGINITLQSTVDSNLRLLNGNGFVFASNDAALPDDSVISIATSRIDTPAYAAAYYAAIDPNKKKIPWKNGSAAMVLIPQTLPARSSNHAFVIPKTWVTGVICGCGAKRMAVYMSSWKTFR